MNTMRIAIVEDEKKDMLQLTGVLTAYAENHGLTIAIDTFSSGESFLRAFEPEKYKLVFSTIISGTGWASTWRARRGRWMRRWSSSSSA